MNIRQFLDAKVADALHSVGAPEGSAGMVRPSARVNFGDYQANGVMAVAKRQGVNPRDMALKVQAALETELGDVVEKLEVAGPGFINIFLKPGWVAAQLEQSYGSDRAGVSLAGSPQTVVVDLSAPNVAKEMHVGHLRSTVIGDAVSRTLEFLGHRVIRANHIGDWGTQFGMLIAHLEELQKENPDIMKAELGDLEQFYRESKTHYDSDPDFAARARNYVVKLQRGDAWCLQMWRKLVDVTMVQNQITYDRLNVNIGPKDTMGESMYNDMLPAIVTDLKAKGIAVEDDGALVVFLDEFKGKDGDAMGVIIQKRDGGFLYTTTDIACAKYRYETLGADRVLYYIDARQAQHLQHAWTIVRKAGYVPESVPLEHHAFGVMLGKDGKPFKTRSGGTVKLSELLDESVVRATALIAQKSPDMDPRQQAEVANAVAIGAVKYSDLSKNRTTDYIFDWDNMLSFEGNTAPYLQYAVTRIRSIFRKGNMELSGLEGKLLIVESEEQALATKLLQFNEVVDNVAREGCPHLMCTYLYELAGAFMSFYEACPVNKDGVDPAVRASRLKLCALVASELELGLDLLGIETVEQM
ncbi:arginine--tRNA ligase [Aestuariirhabdus sp. LZHN29]|uniref:arginine--tRNA ligase n=1 Tax=Aestuariirhabdus sp. LZHN29 TaxID=3417462 RepID=UPI003CE8E447